MPKFIFKCNKCKKEFTKLVPKKWNNLSCECGGVLIKQIPSTGSSVVTEIINKHTNTKIKEDQKLDIKERHDKYYWEVEVPRMVNSGTYSLETMLEMGWVYYNDNKELVTRTKPPYKD